jgi:hypothetical protein
VANCDVPPDPLVSRVHDALCADPCHLAVAGEPGSVAKRPGATKSDPCRLARPVNQVLTRSIQGRSLIVACEPENLIHLATQGGRGLVVFSFPGLATEPRSPADKPAGVDNHKVRRAPLGLPVCKNWSWSIPVCRYNAVTQNLTSLNSYLNQTQLGAFVLTLRTYHECMTSQTGCRANGCPPHCAG